MEGSQLNTLLNQLHANEEKSYTSLAPAGIALALIPVIGAFVWPAVYVVIAGLVVVAGLRLLRVGPGGDRLLTAIFVAKVAVLLCMIAIHRNLSTLFNSLALCVTDFAIWAMFIPLWSTPMSPRKFWRRVLYWLFISIGMALAVSVLAAGHAGLSNVWSDVQEGNRLRLLALEDSGHSMLVDYGCAVLAIALSGICRFKARRQIALVAVSIVALVMTKTALALLAIAYMAVVFAVESISNGRALKNSIYAVILVSAVALNNFFDIDDLGRFLRVDLMGQPERTTLDYTSGRSQLTELLIDVANDNPLIGHGNENLILEYGTSLFNPNAPRSQVSITESSLRLAVKYGYEFFALVLVFALASLRVLSFSDRRIRILGLSVGGFAVISMFANSPLEVPHAYSYFVLSVLVYGVAFTRMTSSPPRQSEPTVVDGAKRWAHLMAAAHVGTDTAQHHAAAAPVGVQPRTTQA